MLTWVSRSEHSGSGEVAVVSEGPLGLVVGVHEERGVSSQIVRLEARAAGLDRPAVNALAAYVVYVQLESLVTRSRFRDAPLLPSLRCRHSRNRSRRPFCSALTSRRLYSNRRKGM